MAARVKGLNRSQLTRDRGAPAALNLHLSLWGIVLCPKLSLSRSTDPDVLVWRDVPMPEPGPGQVRI